MRILRNALNLILRPRLARDYWQFLCARIRHSGEIVRTLPDGLEIGGLTGFSEFHSLPSCLDVTDRLFLQTFPLGEGPILDVGANLGIFSLLLAKRFPKTRIHAFEPNPTTFLALKANFVRNCYPNAHAHRLAAAAHDGEIGFLANPIHRANTHIVTTQAPNCAAPDNSSSVTHVPCITLDGFVAMHRLERIGLLKVDVEGFEPLVFQGSRRLLESGRAKTIYYEVCPELARQAGFAPEAASKELLTHNYRLHTLGTNGRLQSADLDQINCVRVQNWIAIHN